MRQYRQGDILIVEDVSASRFGRPWRLIRLPHKTLAEGERTGHCHEVVGEVEVYCYADEPERRWLRAVAPVVVRHPEHREIEIPAGDWLVLRQIRYVPPSTARSPLQERWGYAAD